MKRPSSIIIYAAATKLTDGHQQIRTANGYLYIRAHERIGETPEEAVSHASPDEGEVVLNAIQHPRTLDGVNY